jgi:hypothetical protein
MTIQVGVLLVSGAAALWRISRAREKELQDLREGAEKERKKLKEEFEKTARELREKIELSAKDDAEKRKAIYEKLEDSERRYEELFVRQQTCNILHGALKEATGDIASDVKKLLSQGGG